MAEHCTFEIGGPAKYFVRCAKETELIEALEWANQHDAPTFVLGGGSNVLVADRGFDGLVIQPGADGIEILPLNSASALVRIGAGAPWDRVVEETVAAGLGGIECLAGIPGLAGAAPIQNIGAYGQEIAETLVRVQVVERRSGEILEIPADACGFGYRWSRFKGEWRDRYIVTRLDLELPSTDQGVVRYGELERRLAGEEASPARVRETVLELRRAKSMVLDPTDPNRRSAGSFFLNPVIAEELASAVAEEALRRGIERPLPRFPAAARPGTTDQSGGRVKVPAAWLIEESGFFRGYGNGRAGLSSRHCLALINRGEATAEDLIALARQIRLGVLETFGVALEPEPVFLGFERSVEELLS